MHACTLSCPFCGEDIEVVALCIDSQFVMFEHQCKSGLDLFYSQPGGVEKLKEAFKLHLGTVPQEGGCEEGG